MFNVLFAYFHPDLGFKADNRKILKEIGSLHYVDNGEHGFNLFGYFPFILRQLHISTRTGTCTSATSRIIRNLHPY